MAYLARIAQLARSNMVTQSALGLSMLQGVNCFLFDLDGTIIDSSPCHERSYLMTLESDLPHLRDAFDYELYKGRSTKETFIALGVEDEETLGHLTRKKQQTYRQMIENGDIPAIPFALEVLQTVKEHGHRAWIVTGASRLSAERVLAKLGMRQYFEALITADDSPKSKPAPDLYLKCLDNHAIDRTTAIAIEDALLGIQSANAAGLKAIAVNNSELAHMPEYVGTLKDLLERLLVRYD